MEMGLLVQRITTLLAPCLPFWLKLDQKAAKKESGKLEKKLWEKLQPVLEVESAALEAAEDVAHNPEDEDAIAAL